MDKLYSLIYEYANSSSWDIDDDYSTDILITAAHNIARQLRNQSNALHNLGGGEFITFSNYESEVTCTFYKQNAHGTSYCMSRLNPDTDYKYIVDMINESWYNAFYD